VLLGYEFLQGKMLESLLIEVLSSEHNVRELNVWEDFIKVLQVQVDMLYLVGKINGNYDHEFMDDSGKSEDMWVPLKILLCI